MNNLCYTPLEMFLLISCSIFSIVLYMVLLYIFFNCFFNWSIDPVGYIRVKIRDYSYRNSINNPYLLYKKLRPRKPMDMRDWVFKYLSSNYLNFSDCQSLTYDEFIRYFETLIKVSKRLVLRDKQLLDMQSSVPISEEDIYEFIHKEILKVIDSKLHSSNFKELVSSNASDFISFLDRNRPSTIPSLEECPQNKISYYACIKDIKSHLGLNTF